MKAFYKSIKQLKFVEDHMESIVTNINKKTLLITLVIATAINEAADRICNILSSK